MPKIDVYSLSLFCCLLLLYCPSVKAQQHPASLNPLMTAISSGDVTTVGQLIEDGADVNAIYPRSIVMKYDDTTQ